MHTSCRYLCTPRLWQAFKSTHRPLRKAVLTTRTRIVPTQAYSGKEKEQLLKGVSSEHREDVARILEQAQRAEATWSTVYTDFYTPPVIADAVQALRLVPDVRPSPWGGYAMAERTRLKLSRADMPEESAAEVWPLSQLFKAFCFCFSTSHLQEIAELSSRAFQHPPIEMLHCFTFAPPCSTGSRCERPFGQGQLHL